MSTKTLDGDLDLVRDRFGGRGFFATVALVIEALGEGRRAEAAYRSMTARGISPEKAAAEAFRSHFES